jgi:PAS domain S-box-containing protein
MSVDRPISFPDVEETDRPEASGALATLIEASSLAIVTFDPEGVVTMWNPAAEQIFGWSGNEAIGTRLPFVPAEKQVEFLALRRRSLLGEAFTEPELHRRRADGSPIVVSASTAPLHRTDGTIYGILSILMDVTDHRSPGDEEAVRQLARKVREALNSG